MDVVGTEVIPAKGPLPLDRRMQGVRDFTHDEMHGPLTDDMIIPTPAHYENPGPTKNLRGIELNTSRDYREPLDIPPSTAAEMPNYDGPPSLQHPECGDVHDWPRFMPTGGREDPHPTGFTTDGVAGVTDRNI